jgi:hypothetical protein
MRAKRQFSRGDAQNGQFRTQEIFELFSSAAGRQRLCWTVGIETFTQKTVHATLQGGGGTEGI